MTRIRRWKSLFYKRILERGKTYYEHGFVYDFEDDGHFLSALVGKDSTYDVLIEYEDEHVVSAHCGCPYARGGYNCKHMAAVLYKSQENEEEDEVPLFVPVKKIEPVELLPFHHEGKEYYFDLDKASRRYDIYDDAYGKALTLAHDEKTTSDIEQSFTREGDKVLDGDFMIAGKFHVRFRMARDKFLDLQCDDRKCFLDHFSRVYNKANRRICVHELAALVLLDEYICRYDPGDDTNEEAYAFLNRFPYALAETSRTADVGLYPRLEAGKDRLDVSFRAGGDKPYVVRNLSHFVDARQKREAYLFTAKGKVDFALHDIREEDEDLFSFLRLAVKDEEARKQLDDNRSYYYDPTVGSKLPLSGSRLDEFFELCCYRNIDISDASEVPTVKYEAELIEDEPELSLDLQEYVRDGKFRGLRLSGSLPRFYEGGAYDYYLEDHRLVRTKKRQDDVTDLFADSRNIDMIIGRKSLGRFYNHVLPKLRQQMDIDVKISDRYLEQIPPKALFEFFFDVRDGNIFCLANVIYGTETYNILANNDRDGRIDMFAEEKVTSLIETVFRPDAKGALYQADSFDDTIIKILEDIVPALMKLGDVHTTDAFDRLGRKKPFKFSLGVKVQSDLLELDINSDDVPLEDLAGIVGSYRLKKKYHKLKNGQLVRVDEESVEDLSNMLEELGVSLKDFVNGKMDIPAYRALYLDSLLQERDEVYDRRDRYFNKLIDSFNRMDGNDYEVPEHLKDTMRGYQQEGFRWLKTLYEYGFGGILADEMGLGKSLQTIAMLEDYKKEKGNITALIVCPSSLVYNWLSEVAKFSDDLDAFAITGSKTQRTRIINSYQDHDVLVTSYELLRRDIDLYEDKQFAFEILDEAQYIKTFSTANAKSCKAIRAKHRFALTGTPIENNLSELWSIFDYLMPGFLYRYEDFRNTFENKIVVDSDERAAARLKKMIAPFILRRRKMEVLKDLPDKIEEIVKVRFADKQQKLYDSQVLKMTDILADSSDEQFKHSKIAILAELTKIRQICCEPSLIFSDYDGKSAKRDACLELLASAIDGGHKVLVFSQFTSMLEVIEKQLKERNIVYYVITGKTKKEERLRLVNAFNEDDVPVFLISLKAGGTGLNLTGADIVIHYDPWWNVAAQDQASDRAHRIGQTRIVTVYKIIADGSIEEKIIELQQKKADLIETVLANDNTSLSSLSREDILELLK